MASSILGPSQIIFTPGTISDLEIIFPRRPHDPTTTRHFWRCSRRFEAPPPPPIPNFGASGAVLWAMRPFLSRTAIRGYPAFRGRNYPGSTSVTISLWRRICFCRSLNHRNDWDPTPCSSSQLYLPSSYKSYCGWSPTPRQSPACYTLFLLQRYNRHLNSNV